MIKNLKVKTIVSENGFSQNSYLCFNENTMFLIDCGCTKEAFISALKDDNLQDKRLDCILLTHTHFDHIAGLFDVWELNKCDVYIAKNCEDFIYDSVKNVSAYFGGFVSNKISPEHIKSVYDAQVVNICGVEVTAYSTKGHSLCSMCYKVGNVLFTGDTVLEGTIGRCDLYGSSLPEMNKSLLKLKEIQFEVAYPGHGKQMDKALVDGIIHMYTN